MWCITCGKPLKMGRYFCSQKCRRPVDFLKRWLEEGGRVDPRIAKKYLIGLRGERCEQCGWNEVHSVTKHVPLELDHIDGDTTNDAIENLRLICPNCHSLTETYRGLNRNSARTHRKKYYQQFVEETVAMAGQADLATAALLKSVEVVDP